jgi:hypothetical protein
MSRRRPAAVLTWDERRAVLSAGGDAQILAIVEKAFHLLDTATTRVDELEALLARVRCFAVVDPAVVDPCGKNPRALGAARMVGIERDIDEACEHVPKPARLDHQRLGGGR